MSVEDVTASATATSIATPVVRGELIARVMAAPPGSAVVITAPAGFGKSTLLDQLHQAWPTSAIVRLEPWHDSPARFVQDLMAVLGRPHVDIDLPEIGSVEFTTMIVDLVDRGDRDGAPCVLVFDDVHHITNNAVLDAISSIVWATRRTNVVLASRRIPPIGVARLKVRRRVVIIDESDLELDSEQAAALVASFLREGAGGDWTHVDGMLADVKRFGGWPAGLVLYGMALAQGHASPTRQAELDLRSFVREEILDLLPDDLRDFVLELAVVGVFDAALIQSVVGRHDAQRLLDEVVSRRLFVEAHRSRPEWWQFHDVFATLLRREAERLGPDRRRELERGTIAHLVDSGENDLVASRLATLDDALVFIEYLAGNDETFRISHVYEAVLRPELDGVRRALNRVPIAEIGESPVALMTAAFVALALGDRPRAKALRALAIRSNAWDAREASPDVPALDANFALRIGDLPPAIEAYEAAIARSGPPRPDPQGVYFNLLGMVDALFLADRLADASRVSREAITAADEVGIRLCIPGLHATIGVIDAMNGRRADAELSLAAARAAMTHSRTWWDRCQTSTLHALLMRLDGDLAAARSILVAAVSDTAFDDAWVSGGFQYAVLADIEQCLGRDDESRSRIETVQMFASRGTGIPLFERLVRDVRNRLGDTQERAVTVASEVPMASSVHDLSERERTILRLLRSRLTLREIGDELYLSVNTVKTHTRSIYRKLGVASRAEVLALYRSDVASAA